MSEGGLLELLESGDVDGFNAKRGERSRPELFAADLAGKDLHGAELSGANLDKADLTGTDLSEASLTRATLVGVDATGAKLVGVMGVKCKLAGAWLDGADLSEADLSRADLSEAILTRSSGESLRLIGARMKGVDARDVRWPGVDLSEAQLGKGKFEGAELTGANLGGAVGPEADFTRARMDGISARDARFPEAKFHEASLVGAGFAGANLSGADLTGADLTSADLSRANLAGAKLGGARLNGASLADAALEGADLAGVSLAGVDLSGIDAASLGLSTEQLAGISAIGVTAEEGAPVRIAAPRAARVGAVVAVCWENVDRLEELPAVDEELEPPPPRRHGTVRVLVLGAGAVVESVLPVPLDSVLASGVAPRGSGFEAWVVRERAGGVAAMALTIGTDGRVGGGPVAPIGYEPLCAPVGVGEGGQFWLYGLARRGPVAIVHKAGESGLAPVRSDAMATAQRFVSRHHPIVACKGGVVVPLGVSGPGKPLRTPPGFPGTQGCVVPAEDRHLAVWFAAGTGREAPTLRLGWLVARGSPEVLTPCKAREPASLDALGGADPWITWLDGDQPMTMRASDPEPLAAGPAQPGATEVSWIPADDGPPLLLVTSMGSISVREPDGRVVASWPAS
jgi:uncharacterized protein YjbI with pentapeptide repeats